MKWQGKHVRAWCFRVLITSLLVATSGAQAATLDVVGGQLVGAPAVDVDGALYNVKFLDGTCIAVFNGCDSNSDFTFQTLASANLAAQALLDQVLVDGAPGAFDTDPELTNGCSDISFCFVNFPYEIAPGAAINVTIAINAAPPLGSTAQPATSNSMCSSCSARRQKLGWWRGCFASGASLRFEVRSSSDRNPQ